MTPLITLVIAVYNAVKYLELIFAALGRQTMKDFEVIVADDGSGPAIADLIGRTRPAVSFPIRHLWQNDQGFRKNMMLNKAIEAARNDYLVFIDGDCLPHRHFLRDHWTYRVPRGVLCGRRVNLSKGITDRLTVADITGGRFERPSLRLLLDGMLARSSYLEESVRITNPVIRKILHPGETRLLGCNFSVARSDIEAINGFDEDYRSPGLGEDSDIAYRFRLNGAELVNLRYLAILFHLFHPATAVGAENNVLFERMVRRNHPVCLNGIRKPSGRISPPREQEAGR